MFSPIRFRNIIGIETLSFDDNTIFPCCFMQSKLGVITNLGIYDLRRQWRRSG